MQTLAKYCLLLTKNFSNRCSKAAHDVDLYLVKQYLPIMNIILYLMSFFLKNAVVEFVNFFYA